MAILGNAENLELAILQAARSESAASLEAAEGAAGKIITDAGERALSARDAVLEAARAEAARRGEMMLSSLPLEKERLRALRLESWLNSIKAESLNRIPAAVESAGKSEVLAGLAAAAAAGMEGRKFVVSVAPGDLPAAAGLAAEMERRVGRGALQISLEEDPGLAGGVMLRDGEGRQYWDNGFKARLERFWPGLRGRLTPPRNGPPGREK